MFKGRRFTPQERRFATIMAATGDKKYAAAEAGYRHPSVSANQALQRPAVQAEIARIQTARLFQEGLPIAVQTLIDVASDAKMAGGARVQAAKIMLDRTLGTPDATNSKQPHEMTPEELEKAIAEAKLRAAALEGAKADQARPVLEHETIDDPDPGIFG